MPAECPFCHASVVPGRDAHGLLVCPACRNTGRPVQPAGGWVEVPAASAWTEPGPGPAASAWTEPEQAPAWTPAPAAGVACPYCYATVQPIRNLEGLLVCPTCHNTGRALAHPPAPPMAPAPGTVACPFCHSPVAPVRNLEGRLVCPACHNTGRLAAPAPQAPGRRVGPLATMLAIGAFTAILLGTALGVAFAPGLVALGVLVGLGLAITAIVLGAKARRNGRAGVPGEKGYGAAALAVAWSLVGLFGVAFLGGLIAGLAGLAGPGVLAEDTLTIPAGQAYLQGFELRRDATVAYEVEVISGSVETGLYPTADAQHPFPSGPGTAFDTDATRASGHADLERGDHTLRIACMGPYGCRVHFRLGTDLS